MSFLIHDILLLLYVLIGIFLWMLKLNGIFLCVKLIVHICFCRLKLWLELIFYIFFYFISGERCLNVVLCGSHIYAELVKVCLFFVNSNLFVIGILFRIFLDYNIKQVLLFLLDNNKRNNVVILIVFHFDWNFILLEIF